MKLKEIKKKKTNCLELQKSVRSTLRISSDVQACYNSSTSSTAMQLSKYFPK